MKYLSLIILFGFIYTSWRVVHTPQGVNEEIHMSIQDELREIIAQQIAKTYPNSREISVDKMWTENKKGGKVKALFDYSFQDGGTERGGARVEVKGYTILSRAQESTAQKDVWTFNEVHFLDNHIKFDEGFVIRAGEEN